MHEVDGIRLHDIEVVGQSPDPCRPQPLMYVVSLSMTFINGSPAI